jgi:transposase
MTKVQIFSGIDISKNSFNVCVKGEGRAPKQKKFPYTAEGMAACLAYIPRQSVCIMESTGTYHCRLAYFLFDAGRRLCVVNPLSVKRYAQALMLRTKTDKADSHMLAEYGRMLHPAPWKPQKEHYVELRQLINLQEQFIKQEAVMRNQLEGIAHSVVQSRFVREKLLQQLKQIRADREEVEAQLEGLVKLHSCEDFERLQSIPGIGKKTAIVLIALTQGLEDFDSVKQISSYFGLCPRIYDSGTSVRGRAGICKMGMALIRKLLYMCALSAKRSNKACRELYERLLAKGKKKKVILIAVANKLLRQAFAIVKHKMMYDENFLSEKFAF